VAVGSLAVVLLMMLSTWGSLLVLGKALLLQLPGWLWSCSSSGSGSHQLCKSASSTVQQCRCQASRAAAKRMWAWSCSIADIAPATYSCLAWPAAAACLWHGVVEEHWCWSFRQCGTWCMGAFSAVDICISECCVRW
jgi:hypothetical protein